MTIVPQRVRARHPASGPPRRFKRQGEPHHSEGSIFTMADSPTTLTHAEIQAFADRLVLRGASTVFAGQPHVQGDMRTAAAVIRALLARGSGSLKSLVLE